MEQRHGEKRMIRTCSKGTSDKWLFLNDFQIFGENWFLENARSPGGLGNSKNPIFQKSAKEDKRMHLSEVPKDLVYDKLFDFLQ